MSDAYAELFQDAPLGVNFNIPAVDTYELWGNASSGKQGPLDLIIGDAPNARMVVAENGKATYNILVSSQFGATKPSLVTATILLNDVVQSNLTMYREIGTPNDVGSGTITGVLDLEVGDVLTLAYKTDAVNNDIVLFHVNVSISSIVRAIVPTS